MISTIANRLRDDQIHKAYDAVNVSLNLEYKVWSLVHSEVIDQNVNRIRYGLRHTNE